MESAAEDSTSQIAKDSILEGPFWPEPVRVLPAPVAQDPDVAGAMARDNEVEAIAKGVALNYERAQRREPEDVSAESLGFDIRSKGPDGPRYIEVKGRAAMGSMALTRNEWIKAQRFGADYWLYIVVNCKSEPQLYVLQNPAAVLRPEEELEVVRYIVRAEIWQQHAIESPVFLGRIGY
jgi:hypothetical protein